MNVAYIYVNLAAFLCFILMFIAFFAAEGGKELRAWKLLLADIVLWSGGSLFMRLNIYPGEAFWYYVSLLALFSIAFLVHNYVCQFANAKPTVSRMVWLAGTIIILLITPTGFFLAPPVREVNELGREFFTYTTGWQIAIPCVFFMVIVASIIKLFKKVIFDQGSSAPGVKELIIGCFMLALGNIVQILPGNTFPWDTLSGVVFAIMITVSLYKRRMFNSKLLISSSILTTVSAVTLLVAAAYFFPRIKLFIENHGVKLFSAEIETFALLSIALYIIVLSFSKLLKAVFTVQDAMNARLNNYSEKVSKTLDIDSVLKETVRVIRSHIRVNQVYICLLQNGEYVPACSATPLKPAAFSVSTDHPCIKYFETGENHLVLKDFEANPLYKSIWGSERDMLNEFEVSSICALKDGENIFGLVMLSEKEKGTSFTYEDFSFLNTVCSIASIAVKNAALYKQVAEREHLFSSMTEFIPNVILIKPKGEDRLSFVSANTQRILGITYDELANKPAKQLMLENLGEEETARAFESLSKDSGLPYSCVLQYKRPDDLREISVRCVFSPIFSDGLISNYVCVVNDITEDIAAQELLKNSVELAQNSNKAKSEFLSHMSHEIRTPMNSIAGLTYLAKEIAEKGDNNEITEYLCQIDQSSQYLLSLLNNIMDMSKIENEKYELHNSVFNVNDILDELYSVYAAQMTAKQVDFSLDVEDFRYASIFGDEISLRKILNNLLSNAYKFTPAGGSVLLRASQSMTPDRKVLMHFEVMDTGAGVSDEFKLHIFEPYTQEVSSTGAKSAGSGLGMAICKSMVDLQGGNISMESELGKGTCFYVDIPYILHEIEVTEHEEIDFSVLDKKRIMVVDDVMINTLITKKLLENKGVIVDCAENGQKALELFESKNDFYYDCILMDIQMPVMDGIEASSEIRAVKKRYSALVPIIAMTADVFMSDFRNGNSNFTDYVIKPISPDELYEKLTKYLNN